MELSILKIVVCLSTISACFASEKGISCYKCSHSTNEPDDDCPELGFDGAALNATVDFCEAPNAACVKSKEKLTLGSGFKIIRRCLDPEFDKDEVSFHGCKVVNKDSVGALTEVNICVCHNDKCNSAVSIVSAILLVSVSSLLSIFIL